MLVPEGVLSWRRLDSDATAATVAGTAPIAATSTIVQSIIARNTLRVRPVAEQGRDERHVLGRLPRGAEAVHVQLRHDRGRVIQLDSDRGPRWQDQLGPCGIDASSHS